jgi:hypothetical protein
MQTYELLFFDEARPIHRQTLRSVEDGLANLSTYPYLF